MLKKDEFTEFINGELLGDGCVAFTSKTCTSARYSHGTKYKEYLLWLSDELEKFGIYKTGKIYKNLVNVSGKDIIRYSYCTKCYDIFKNFREKWYPNGKKIVPKDIKLTPITIRQWYIGDGSLHRSRDDFDISIGLSTESFSKNDVEFLVKELNKLNINSNVYKKKIEYNDKVYYRYVIHIFTKSLLSFFDYIGECPEEINNIYGYKWLTNEERNKLIKLKEKELIYNNTYRNKNWLYNQYINNNKKPIDISKEFNISLSSIYRCINKYKLREIKCD